MQLLEQETKKYLSEHLRVMLLIRKFEQQAAEQYTKGNIKGFLHLYIGEEAIATGVISTLQPQDYVVTHYRDHGHALARGMAPKVIMAELFGKSTGCSKGKGGSMHLFDTSLNFMGGYAIVGGHLPIATGLALAAKYKNTDQVVVCFLGDGALNQGEFHESMNLAALWKLPLVFVLENNLFGMGTRIERTFAAGDDVYKLAKHYAMPSCKVDGMDVLETSRTTREIVNWVREGNGPYFLEAMTYRFSGHSMADPQNYRDKNETESWKSRDPITSFSHLLLNQKILSEEEIHDMEEDLEVELSEAISFAEESPFPDISALEEDVYRHP